MKIYFRDELIWNNIGSAATFFTRMKGLLGRISLDPGEGLLISPCRQVHCFHMKFPIDTLFLDRQYKVLKILTLNPGQISPVVKDAYYVLEVTAGQAQKFGIVPEDRLIIENEKQHGGQ